MKILIVIILLSLFSFSALAEKRTRNFAQERESVVLTTAPIIQQTVDSDAVRDCLRTGRARTLCEGPIRATENISDR